MGYYKCTDLLLITYYYTQTTLCVQMTKYRIDTVHHLHSSVFNYN